MLSVIAQYGFHCVRSYVPQIFKLHCSELTIKEAKNHLEKGGPPGSDPEAVSVKILGALWYEMIYEMGDSGDDNTSNSTAGATLWILNQRLLLRISLSVTLNRFRPVPSIFMLMLMLMITTMATTTIIIIDE